MIFPRSSYQLFLADWSTGLFKGQRFGQAFYNYFNLYVCQDNHGHEWNIIYNTNENTARALIGSYIDPSC